MPLHSLVVENGIVDPVRLSAVLDLSMQSLALSAGISYDSICSADRSLAANVQHRLREMISIIDRVTPWAGGQAQAFAWYRSYEIASLGMTAEQAVNMGRSDYIWAHINHIAEGGYA